MGMQFDNLPPTPYLAIVLDIIRKGIAREKGNLKLKVKEGIKNQQLEEVFNEIATQNEKMWIGVSKEHTQLSKQSREDIYFYLGGDKRPRIFYTEGKRLPKFKTPFEEEYVLGINTSGNPSGGIERFKLGIHGESQRLKHNGLIAYIENKTVAEWEKIINKSIAFHYPDDTVLQKDASFTNEYTSTHNYSGGVDGYFKMYHFWIDLTQGNDV